MAPTTTLLDLLLLLLLLTPDIITALFLSLVSESSGSSDVVERAMSQVVSGPVRGHDLTVVMEERSQVLVDVGRVITAAGASLTPAVLTTQHSLLRTLHPARQTKTSSTTAIIIFYNDPTSFFHYLAENRDWNPGYLILVSLNPSLNTTSLFSLSTVQRSQFLLLLHPSRRVSDGRLRLRTYTSPPILGFKAYSFSKVIPLGVWDHENVPSRQSLFPSRFGDFKGQVMEVTLMVQDEPFLYADSQGNVVGVNMDALRIIAGKLNFRLSVSEPDLISWGSKINGTWVGFLGDLAYKGKHLVINVLQPSPERSKDFDFTYPYWEDSFAFLLRMPPPLPQWRNILYPFSTRMWGFILAVTLAVSSLLAFLLHHVQHTTDSFDVVLKIAAGVVRQSVNLRAMRAWWARVWLVTWWLSVQNILCSVYTGNLVAVLTVPVYPPLINTVHDLAASNIVPAMVDYGSYVPEALKASQKPTLAVLGEKLYLDTDLRPENPYAKLQRSVLAGTHAVIVTYDYLVYTQHRAGLMRSTYIMDEKIYSAFMSWFLPLHTPYTTTLSDHLIRLLETGILHKLYRDHVGILISANKQVRGDGVLNLEHLQGAFLLLGLGTVLATHVLVMERIV